MGGVFAEEGAFEWEQPMEEDTCLEKGIEAYKKADFVVSTQILEGCLEELREDSLRAEVMRYLAASYVALNLTLRTAEVFKQLLYLDPYAELKLNRFSPKVVAIFDSVKSEVLSSKELKLTSDPPGASVWIKSATSKRYLGKTPMIADIPVSVPTNRYTFIFSKDNYYTESVEITIEDTDSLYVELKNMIPLFGFLELAGVPTGARVTIDGVSMGAGRTFYSMEVGRHDLKVEKIGFEPFEREIRIHEDETTFVRVELVESRAFIDFKKTQEELWTRKMNERKKTLKSSKNSLLAYGLIFGITEAILLNNYKKSDKTDIVMVVDMVSIVSYVLALNSLVNIIISLPKGKKPNFYEEFVKKHGGT